MKKINIISTVVQRGLSGQRVPTGNTIIVEGGGSVDVDALKYEISKDFLKKKEDDRAEGRINFLKGIAINGEVIEGVDTSEEGAEPSDTSVPTTKRVEKRFLRKDKDDRSVGVIASDKGFEVGHYEEGLLGTGASMHKDEDGRTYLEADYMTIRKKATFSTITVQELKHIGGALVLSPASMVCIRVKELTEGYKCYFRQTDAEGRKLYNEFEPGDQARCQTFSLQKNVYYWRLVTEVGEDYIVLSKTDCDKGSDVPGEGDNISLLGNRTKAGRQSAIVLSAYGEDAPSYKQYRGVDSYSLEGKQVTKLSPDGNELSGVLNIEAGSTGAKNLEDFPDEVFKAVHIGAVNLLQNSGFTGNYQPEELNASYALMSGSELYSRGMKHWTGTAEIEDEAVAVSGKCAVIGSLSQSVQMMKGESYVVSFKAKGAGVKVMLGAVVKEQTLTPEYVRYAMKFVSDGIGSFSMSGDATICDLQLERGTIATDWGASPYDNDKTLAEFQALKYIKDAIREGDTTIIGGLILSSMIQLGNYKNGKMQKVTSGVNGIYNEDNDVAFWGGGTFEQAIRTIVKFKENSRYKPTEGEWKELAKYVVTHGGDAVFKGNVFADSGYFRGLVDIAGGKILLNDDGSGHLANKNIRWTKEGVMYRKAPENIEWKKITDFRETGYVTFDKGLYFDLGTHLGDTRPYELPYPEYDYFSIIVKASLPSRRSASAVLESVFRVYDGTDFVNVPYLTIEDELMDYQLVFDVDAWTVRGGKYAIVTRTVNGAEANVVVLGLQTQMNVGDDVESRTEIKEDKIRAQKIELTDATDESFKTKGGMKVEKEILVGADKGTDTWMTKEKVKTQSVEAQTEVLVGSNKETETYLTSSKVNTKDVEASNEVKALKVSASGSGDDSIHTPGGVTADRLKLNGSIGKSQFLASPADVSGAPTFRTIGKQDIEGYADLEKKVNELEKGGNTNVSDIKIIKGSIATMQTSITDMMERITKLEAADQTTATAIEALNKAVDELKEEVDKLKPTE